MRPLTAEDLDWALDVLAARRARLEPYAPVYWRRARDARERHAAWFGAHLDGQLHGAFALRTEHALLFGTPGPGGVLLLDDLAAEEAAAEGELEVLLREAVGRSDRVRLVCPVPEPERVALGRRNGLDLAESWWHRVLPSPSAETHPLGEVEGAQARLVGPPPVYDPGGPVVFVTAVDDEAGLARAEEAGAYAGAVLAVVRQAAGDGDLGRMLERRGYVRHCDFLER